MNEYYYIHPNLINYVKNFNLQNSIYKYFLNYRFSQNKNWWAFLLQIYNSLNQIKDIKYVILLIQKKNLIKN